MNEHKRFELGESWTVLDDGGPSDNDWCELQLSCKLEDVLSPGATVTVPEAVEILNAALTLIQSGARSHDVWVWIDEQSPTLGRLVKTRLVRDLTMRLRIVGGIESTRDFLLRVYKDRQKRFPSSDSALDKRRSPPHK